MGKGTEMETEEKSKNVDPINVHIGDFGRYQVLFWLLICLSKFPSGWVTLAHVFLAGKTQHKCLEPPTEDACSVNCTKADFDRSIFTDTIEMSFNLVCDNFWLSSFSQMMVMFGIMVGSIAFGIFGDRFGRLIAFNVACISQLIMGVAAAFSPHFAVYVVLRFLVACATGGQMTISFVLIMELIGASKREVMSILYQVPFNIGHATLPLFAYFLREWRYLQFSYSIISIIYLIYTCAIYESPRWLFSTGRLEKASSILTKIAKRNKLPTEKISSRLQQDYERIQQEGVKKKGTIIDLFATPNMCRKTLVMLYQWLGGCMVYYGAAQFISKLGGNVFINVFISGILGIPATVICVFSTKYLGRRLSLLMSTLLSAVCFLLIAILVKFSELAVICCSLIGLFGAAITFPNIYLYSGEIFPTVVRSSGIGLCSSIGRVGSMVAPFITSDLGRKSDIIPPLVYGVIAFISFALTFLLPETKNAPVPETLEDGENFKPIIANKNKK